MFTRLLLKAVIVSLTGLSASLADSLEYENVTVVNRSIAEKLALIKSIEDSISMPVHAYPISKYQRFYAFKKRRNERLIIGSFVRTAEKGRIEIVDEESLPGAAFDAGCNVVNLEYSLHRRRVLLLKCSGVAR